MRIFLSALRENKRSNVIAFSFSARLISVGTQDATLPIETLVSLYLRDKEKERELDGINLLTFIDDFAKDIFPSEKVLRRTVPSPIAKLMLALGDGQIRATSHCHYHSRIFPGEFPLLSPQVRGDRWVHVQGIR